MSKYLNFLTHTHARDLFVTYNHKILKSQHTKTSPERNTQRQIDHVSEYRKQISNVTKVQYFMGADCDRDYYLDVAKYWERISIRKHLIKKD
jgi:hypothetical protein